MTYIKPSKIRAKIRTGGRRVGKDFLHALDAFIDHKLEVALRVQNGGKKTLDADVAVYIGIK